MARKRPGRLGLHSTGSKKQGFRSQSLVQTLSTNSRFVSHFCPLNKYNGTPYPKNHVLLYIGSRHKRTDMRLLTSKAAKRQEGYARVMPSADQCSTLSIAKKNISRLGRRLSSAPCHVRDHPLDRSNPSFSNLKLCVKIRTDACDMCCAHLRGNMQRSGSFSRESARLNHELASSIQI